MYHSGYGISVRPAEDYWTVEAGFIRVSKGEECDSMRRRIRQ